MLTEMVHCALSGWEPMAARRPEPCEGQLIARKEHWLEVWRPVLVSALPLTCCLTLVSHPLSPSLSFPTYENMRLAPGDPVGELEVL